MTLQEAREHALAMLERTEGQRREEIQAELLRADVGDLAAEVISLRAEVAAGELRRRNARYACAKLEGELQAAQAVGDLDELPQWLGRAQNSAELILAILQSPPAPDKQKVRSAIVVMRQAAEELEDEGMSALVGRLRACAADLEAMLD